MTITMGILFLKVRQFSEIYGLSTTRPSIILILTPLSLDVSSMTPSLQMPNHFPLQRRYRHRSAGAVGSVQENILRQILSSSPLPRSAGHSIFASMWMRMERLKYLIPLRTRMEVSTCALIRSESMAFCKAC